MFERMLSHSTFALIRILELPFLLYSRCRKSGYQVIVPANTYAPWLKDQQFCSLFRKVKSNSLVNRYQAWELWSLVEQVHKVPGDLLEVGVWRGSTSILMGAKLKALANEKRLYACDTFEGVVKAGHPFDNHYKGGEHHNTSLELVNKNISMYGLNNVLLLKGVFPDDTSHLIDNKKFCLCHIDVDAYVSAKAVLDWVWPKLSVGGMIVFNDYGFPLTKGVTRLFNERCRQPDAMLIHNLNGNGIMVKIC